MKKQALSLAVLVAGAYPAASNALSLGDIESNSNLNQPLRAKIELLSASPQEARQLQVRLAPNSVFNRVGVEKPAFLDSLRFTSTVENGKPVILVSSDSPIAEPFVNFLLEVSWPNGQLLKEYTVMLDPPVLMQPGTAFAGSEAAVRAEPRSTGVVSRPAPRPAASPSQVAAAQSQQQARLQQQQQAQARAQAQREQQARQQALQAQRQQQAQQQRQPQRADSNTGRTYRVRRGDTLFKVATKLQQPGINVDQMMMALYRANPEAFIKKNINGLKAGAVLTAPNATTARSVSRAQARRQVRQQYADWQNFRSTLARKTVPQQKVVQNTASNTTKAASDDQAKTTTTAADKARLEVLGKADKAAAGETSAAGAARLSQLEQQLALARESMVARQRENKELKSRVTDLESMLRKKNRLIALRDDQLAQLQQQLTQAGISPADVKTNAVAPQNTMDNPANGAANQSSVIPRTPGQTRPVEEGISNHVANAIQSQENKIVRAQPPATDANNGANNAVNNALTPAQRAAQARLQQLQQAELRKAEEAKAKAAVKQPEAEPEQNGGPFADQQEGGDDLMSLLTSPMAWKIGGGALLSLILLWLLSRLLGRRKNGPAKASAAVDDPVVYDGDDELVTTAQDEQTFRELERELDKAEQDPEVDDLFAADELNDIGDLPGGTPDIVETKGAQGEDEVLMEANVYIAYGLHQQAESELKKALEKHPERLEYRHKLLENYFASNNRDEFDSHAEQFLAMPGADRGSQMWKDIITWGRKISPDNKLYEDSGLSMGKAAAGVAAAGAAAASVIALGSDKESNNAAINVEPDLFADQADTPSSSTNEVLDNLYEEDDLGLDDFDFDLDELESELGDLDDLRSDELSSEAEASLNNLGAEVREMTNDGLEMADTTDDDLDFSLDDLMEEIQDEDQVSVASPVQPELQSDLSEEVAGAVSNVLEPEDTINFDDLLSDPPKAAAEKPQVPDHSDNDEGIGMLGGLAAGAVAAAGATAAAVMSGKDKVTDTLSSAGDALGDAVSGAGDAVDNALDFDADLPQLDADDMSVEAINHAENTLDFEGELPDLNLPEAADDFLSDSADSIDELADNSLDMVDVDLPPLAEEAATEVAAADQFDELDFDFDEVNLDGDAAGEQVTAAASDNVTNLNLHLDNNSGLKKILPQDTFYANNDADELASGEEETWLGDIDDALSFLDMPDEEIDLHEAHISTKLDLARAYLDMGDIEGARSTLEEVMVEGNDNQRREAETLLHQTG